jgi:hypothetical protein
VAYINFVIESGVSVKEAQALARHATPELTMNVYGRVREERLSEAVEKVAKTLLADEERAVYVHRKVVGADEKPQPLLITRSCGQSRKVEAAGIEPASEGL